MYVSTTIIFKTHAVFLCWNILIEFKLQFNTDYHPCAFSVKLISILYPGYPMIYNFTRCSLNAFNTTETELKAIAAPATHGARKPSAAIGIPMTL